jgi:hypothetical protein
MLSDKVYLVLATATSLFVVVATVALGGWPWWVGVVICVPLIIGGLFLKHRAENKRLYTSPPQHMYQPPQPVQPASTPVQGLVLPSAQRDYHFLLNTTVLWRPSGAPGVPGMPHQLAIDAIRERATRFTERESTADSDLLAPRLAADLSFPQADRTGQLEVWAQNTTLTIPDDDRKRLNRIAEVRKDEEVWEYERAHERNVRAYLREDVLSSTGSAVVWWLSKDATRVQETVGLIDTLARLVAAAQDREVEPIFRTFVNSLTDPSLRTPADENDFVDRLMAEILPNGSEPERADVADRLATLATDAGATDLADKIRTRFNAPDFTADPELFDPLETDPTPDTPSPVHPNGRAESDSSGTPPNPS